MDHYFTVEYTFDETGNHLIDGFKNEIYRLQCICGEDLYGTYNGLYEWSQIHAPRNHIF